MPHPIITGLAVAMAAVMPASAATSDMLAAHRGTARIVLVFADRADDPGLVAQRNILEADRAGTADRDLVLVPVIGSGEEARALAQCYGVDAGRFQVVLVGKDGSAYLRSAKPVQRNDLFSRIDAMPMRQSEMVTRSR